MTPSTEPVVTAGVVSGFVVLVLSYFDIVVEADTLTTLIVAGIPVIGAFLARAKVTPTG